MKVNGKSNYCIFFVLMLVFLVLLTGCSETDSDATDIPLNKPSEAASITTPNQPIRTSIPAPVPQPIGSIKPVAPEFKLISSLYDRTVPVVVEIICPERNGNIYYTLNGTRPNVDSAKYTGPVTVLDENGTMVVLSALFITEEGAVSDLTYALYEHEVAFKDMVVEAIIFDFLKPEDGIIKYSMLSKITDFMVIGNYAVVNDPRKFTTQLGYDFKKYYSEYDSDKVNGRGDIQTLEDLVMMPYLNTVVVNYNRLTAVPDFSDTGLDIFDLKDNFISDVTALKANLFCNTLALDNNKITDLGFLGVESNVSIDNLSLSNNPLEEYPDFRNEINIQNLWLDGTGMDDWPQFEGFAYISLLDLSNNNITALSKPPTLMRIETLILRGNNMTDISNIPKIESNEIMGLGGVAYTDITGYCKNLDLSNNAIEDISPLLELNLTKNLIIKNNSVPLDMDIIKQLTWMDEIIID